MKTYCGDWACPARVSCAHHFGRSSDYASMRGAEGTSKYRLAHPTDGTFPRGTVAPHCASYEYDKPKKWLEIKPGQITHIPEGARL